MREREACGSGKVHYCETARRSWRRGLQPGYVGMPGWSLSSRSQLAEVRHCKRRRRSAAAGPEEVARVQASLGVVERGFKAGRSSLTRSDGPISMPERSMPERGEHSE